MESIIHLSNNPGLIQPLSWSCFSVDPTAWACIDNWSVSCQFIVSKLLCLVDIFVSFSSTSMPVNKLGIAKCTVNNIWKFWTFETLSEFTDNLSATYPTIWIPTDCVSWVQASQWSWSNASSMDTTREKSQQVSKPKPITCLILPTLPVSMLIMRKERCCCCCCL